jgi:cytidylate kinase
VPIRDHQAFENWLHRRQREVASGRPVCPALTLTGLPGAGGKALAPHIVEYLDLVHDCDGGGWFLIDDALLAAATRWGAGALHPAGDPVPAIARLGHCVISCQGAAWRTRPLANVFHALLTGSEEVRVARPGTEPAAGAWSPEHLRARDSELRRALAERYGADLDDPCEYHLVLNTDHFERDLAVRTIADSLLEWGVSRQEGFCLAQEPPRTTDPAKKGDVLPNIREVFPRGHS